MHSSPLHLLGKRSQTPTQGILLSGVIAFSFFLGSTSIATAGSSSRVTLATAPESFSTPGTDASGHTNSKPGPEDLSARGQELENTFYEIDEIPPYGNLPPPKPGNNSTPVKGMEGLNEGKAGMSWSMWAAGAAGIVGLGALGYMVLSEDPNKTPQPNVRIISDIGQ